MGTAQCLPSVLIDIPHGTRLHGFGEYFVARTCCTPSVLECMGLCLLRWLKIVHCILGSLEPDKV